MEKKHKQTNLLLCHLNTSPVIQVWTLVPIWSNLKRIENVWSDFFFPSQKEGESYWTKSDFRICSSQKAAIYLVLLQLLQRSSFWDGFFCSVFLMEFSTEMLFAYTFSSSIFSYSHPGIRISGKTFPKKFQRRIKQFPKTEHSNDSLTTPNN